MVAWREEAGVSAGAELADRPALLAALEDLVTYGVAILVVAKRDRFARDVLKAGAIEAAAAARGARVVSADGVAEGNDPTAILLRKLLDSFAQFEREMSRARTRAALQAKKARGLRVEGAYGKAAWARRRNARRQPNGASDAGTGQDCAGVRSHSAGDFRQSRTGTAARA